MNCTLYLRNEIEFLFTKHNVPIYIPSILHIFVLTWRWPSWPKHV